MLFNTLTLIQNKNMGRTPNTEEQETISFWGRVDTSGNCWIWMGGKCRFGYGSSYSSGKYIKAHRHAYILSKGNIPKELEVMHSCDNPSCVRPEHLSLGTHRENMQDSLLRGRRPKYLNEKRSVCKRGHNISSPENVYVNPNHPEKGRICRICRSANNKISLKKWRERNKASNGKESC